MIVRAVVALAIAVVVALTLIGGAGPDAGAWKCEYHPEKPTCTTTTGPPVTVNTTIVQSTTVPETTVPEVTTTVPDTTTTTSTTMPPEVSENPPSIERPPEEITLAG